MQKYYLGPTSLRPVKRDSRHNFNFTASLVMTRNRINSRLPWGKKPPNIAFRSLPYYKMVMGCNHPTHKYARNGNEEIIRDIIQRWPHWEICEVVSTIPGEAILMFRKKSERKSFFMGEACQMFEELHGSPKANWGRLYGHHHRVCAYKVRCGEGE